MSDVRLTNANLKRGKSKPSLTIGNLETWLSDNSITVRRNLITHNMDVSGLNQDYNPETLNNDLHIILHDKLKSEFQCTASAVGDLLGVVAGKQRFNPVLDWLSDAPQWDRTDRFEEIFSILHIDGDDQLSQLLLRKWLIQCRSLLDNHLGDDSFGADGVLVLTGPQGIGKTSFAQKIAGKQEFGKIGQYVDFHDKDTIRRCTSTWICELGEVEKTMRTDCDQLKSFITQDIDEYRLPYGRNDSVIARRTSLIATCNSSDFLVDSTGSRRFWTVPVNLIDLDRLRDLDVLQLWKQAETYSKADPQSFRLTPFERELLAARNVEHERMLPSQAEIMDIFQQAEDEKGFWQTVEMTVSQFKEENASLSRYSVEKIGKALDKLGIESARGRIDGKQARIRKLPHHISYAEKRYG